MHICPEELMALLAALPVARAAFLQVVTRLKGARVDQ